MLLEDLNTEVSGIFKSVWSRRDGTIVPDPEALRLGNDAVELDATVLYADLAGSTQLVDTHNALFAAEVYKTFLRCAARIVKHMGGSITAYDGDRIMAVYIGNTKNTDAAKTALHLNWAVQKVIRPAMSEQYPDEKFVVRHGVGIDTSKITVARIGVKNDNDLVWVGRAANHAAKLCGVRDGDYSSWITQEVYNMCNDSAKTSVAGKSMWEQRKWTAMNDRVVYRSNWIWALDK